MTNQFNCEERSSLSVIASLTALAVRLAISFLAIEKGLKAIFPGLLTLWDCHALPNGRLASMGYVFKRYWYPPLLRDHPHCSKL